MTDELTKLLRYIARNYTGPEEVKEVERESPTLPGEELDDERERALRAEERRADDLEDAFRSGLLRAHAAVKAGGDAITLDDRDNEENRIADALVHFLVGPGMATSRTRETTTMHYVYTIWIDWDRLKRVAREADLDLDRVLDRRG